MTRLRKRCTACGGTFGLSGSGRRQNCCSNCAERVTGRGRVSRPSNPLNIKGAKHDFSAPTPPSVREQIEAQQNQPNPITFTTSEGHKGRVWLASDGNKIIGDDRWWRVNVSKLAEEAGKKRKANPGVFDKPVDLMNGTQRANIDRKLRHSILDTELAPPLKGFRVRLYLEDEVPAIGSGQRLVTVQFRGKRVRLCYGPYTATLKRDAFKDLVRLNRRYRKRNGIKPVRKTMAEVIPFPTAAVHAPVIQLDNVIPFPSKPLQGDASLHDSNPDGSTAGALHGDDYPLESYEDGYPVLPECLRRRDRQGDAVSSLLAEHPARVDNQGFDPDALSELAVRSPH